jgi:hypothetical protein
MAVDDVKPEDSSTDNHDSHCLQFAVKLMRKFVKGEHRAVSMAINDDWATICAPSLLVCF